MSVLSGLMSFVTLSLASRVYKLTNKLLDCPVSTREDGSINEARVYNGGHLSGEGQLDNVGWVLKTPS